MFRFQEFYTDSGQNRRVDVCSGPFKHISTDIITQSLCLVQNSQGQILIVHKADSNSWILPGGQVCSGQSPKQTVVEFLKLIGFDIKPKNPEQLAFQKTLNLIEDEVDSSGNPAWEVNSAQVIWTVRVDEVTTFLPNPSYDKTDWINIDQMPKLLGTIYDSAKVLELAMELLEL